jgi:peptidoglycan hydrolase-like protein with peptidoglycan-binding domain
MSDFSYTNAQFRSILNGLGFRSPGSGESNFPISNDESALDNDRQAVVNFQDYFNLATDGIVGPNTRAAANHEMRVIQYELDLVMQPEPRLRPQNAPFYGSQTALAVTDFRLRYEFEPDGDSNNDRVADLPVRRRLDRLTPNTRSEVEGYSSLIYPGIILS